jgi:hypothetical protein
MAKRRVTLEQWLIEAMSDDDKGGPCTAVSLVFCRPGNGSHQEIHTKQVKPPMNAKSLADFFMNKATAYAQDLPGIQTFKVLCFYGSDQPQAEHPFTLIDGEINAGDNINYTKHEPTEKGLMGMLMKHVEVTNSLLMQISQTVTVQAVIREKELRSELTEAHVILRDVFMDLNKQTHANNMEVERFKRETEERRMLGKALPSAINYIAGRDVMPQQLADSEILDAMAEKVKPEHLGILVQMKILTQEQATLLAARFTKTLEERAKEQQLIRVAPPEDKPAELANGTASQES